MNKMVKTILLIALIALFAVSVIALVACEQTEHTHTFSNKWSYDEEYHWHEATCGHDKIRGKRTHEFINGRCRQCRYDLYTRGLEFTDIGYDYDRGGVKVAVTGIGTVTDEIIVIPDFVNGFVTSIAENAFANCSDIVSITLPCNLESIGDNAFAGCGSLVEICNNSPMEISVGEMENGLVSYNALNVYSKRGVYTGLSEDSYGQSNLVREGENLWYSDDVVGNRLIKNYEDKATITLPQDYNGETYQIHQYAFMNHSQLASISFPSKVTGIGPYAFMNCTGLKELTIPNTVESIGMGMLNGCSSLEKLTIPYVGAEWYTLAGTSQEDLEWKILKWGLFVSIFDMPFRSSYKNIPETLKTVIITGGEKIEHEAFYNCENIESIVLPSTLTTIGTYAFVDCTSLKSITIPQNVTGIYYNAFEGCSSLTSVTFENPNGWKYGRNDLDISASDLSNAQTAAQYLTVTYFEESWYRY